MNKKIPYFQVDPWKIIENEWQPKKRRFSESIMSLANGYIGIRGNFEECYSGPTHQGTYYAGIHYPEKTRVGWWKNGYPETFSKVINGPRIFGINVWVDADELDLSKGRVVQFYQELDMKAGIHRRLCKFKNPSGVELLINVEKFLSIDHMHLAVLKYEITPMNQDVNLIIESYLDGDVRNIDGNEEEGYWEGCPSSWDVSTPTLHVKTKKTDFEVGLAMVNLYDEGTGQIFEQNKDQLYVEQKFQWSAKAGKKITFMKLVSAYTSRDVASNELMLNALSTVQKARKKGYNVLKEAHTQAWLNRWQTVDIQISGDDQAQQGIRYNLFQLLSTFDGRDAGLNIGPKGFTGEKYGGGTYWDTEAFCFPMYLAINADVARNLLLYRHHQLEQAYVNAKRQGLDGALYPMVTISGLECHNEWEITFEEIHRNGAIAYAIYQYVNYTDDWEYMNPFGLEVLIGISRFWASRVHLQPNKDVYMIHGVTGPNEYENNVNNNWYTNYIAKWTLSFTIHALQRIGAQYQDKNKPDQDEMQRWQTIAQKMYLPIDEERGIFLQQDGFTDKELLTVQDIPENERPIHKHWSWDKILRSCFIKQADVLQGLYLFSEDFTLEQKKKNYAFYQPMTVHESSLSPSVHCILACEVGAHGDAYQLFLHACRLDLDDYNTDTVDGLHITSMGGGWLSMIHGFLGLRVSGGKLRFTPTISHEWESYQTQIYYRGYRISVQVNQVHLQFYQAGMEPLQIWVYGEKHMLVSEKEVIIPLRVSRDVPII